MASVDQVRGVLTWRIAEYLLHQAQYLRGVPSSRLEAAVPREREHYMTLARSVLGLVDAIESDPPTPGELHRYDSALAMTKARARARVEAGVLGHILDVFRPSLDRTAEVTLCQRCGAGVSINLGTAAISVSEPLSAPCQQTGVSK
jgi:hypothetical protein